MEGTVTVLSFKSKNLGLIAHLWYRPKGRRDFSHAKQMNYFSADTGAAISGSFRWLAFDPLCS